MPSHLGSFILAHSRRIMNNFILEVNGFNEKYIHYTDSVTADMPVILRKNNLLFISRIDSIVNNYEINGDMKEISLVDYLEIYTHNGWSKVKKVRRHFTNISIYRIRTKMGIVDVTEDHSLLDDTGNKIATRIKYRNKFTT